MENRYIKNIGDRFTEELQNICLDKTIAVLGAGGCGGYILEHLARLGVNKIIVFDGDRFEMSNMNRQSFCNHETLGRNKAKVAGEVINRINNSIDVLVVEEYFEDKHIDIILNNNVDIIIHAADPYANVENLNRGINLCLLNRIPLIKMGIGKTHIRTHFIQPTGIGLWHELKNAAVYQSVNDPVPHASLLSFWCALSAVSSMELFLSYIKNPKMNSCTFIYEYETMKTSLEYR